VSVRKIGLPQARRIALAAQGFADKRPANGVNAGHLRRLLEKIGLLQLDSVNVLVRSHYLPVFSRLGRYPRDLLDEYAYRRRRLFEYWAHVASLVPIERYPLFRHRMERFEGWHRIDDLREAHPGYVEWVLEKVRERGPITVSDLEDPVRRRGPWWGWGAAKVALEYHFGRGMITTAGRQGFTRVYDVAERVIPAHLRDGDAPTANEAMRELLLLGARHHGIGTAKDIADYYRLPIVESRRLLDELVASRELEEVEVRGWRGKAYLHPEARWPRRIGARALLSPFDPIVWERDRTERLFDFFYRIEIYVPQLERVYGYYVLPFLLDDRLVARVDLKSDRQGKRLLVRGTYSEEGVDRDYVARELAAELELMADWLGLDGVVVGPKGDLAAELGRRI
jgi:uncharacterized protein YcaQ